MFMLLGSPHLDILVEQILGENYILRGRIRTNGLIISENQLRAVIDRWEMFPVRMSEQREVYFEVDKREWETG
jgi:hypothetical protein